MHAQIVDRVEVKPIIIVDQSRRLVRSRIQSADADSLLASTDGVVAPGCTPDDRAIVESASIRRIYRRIR